MATVDSIRERVRLELGDKAEPFQTVVVGDGETVVYDLPVGLVDTDPAKLKIFTIANNTITPLPSTEYSLDPLSGSLTLVAPLADGTQMFVEGQSWSLFTDYELDKFINDAQLQHNHNDFVTTRSRNENGFIEYTEVPKTLETLPAIEEVLVALLATIEALWALATDASTDVDISTAEGTHIPRGQRYAQIRSQIDVLTEKYADMAQQLNVGLHRIEVSTLRRVSRSTGRLVPVFTPREYDDHDVPTRQLPPIDQGHRDESGVPSPMYGGWGGF